MKRSQPDAFVFNPQELGGALGDLGTLLPLMVALILINGLNPTSVLVGVGLFYIVSGWYFRIPMPVQPLKAMAAISISLGLSASIVNIAGLLFAGILLFLSVTNAISVLVKLFPRAVTRGIQLSIGLILTLKGIEHIFGQKLFINTAPASPAASQFPVALLLAALALIIFIVFKFAIFRQSQRYSPSLAVLVFGVVMGIIFGAFPGLGRLGPAVLNVTLPDTADFWVAFTVLVIPQLPLTLGNAVVGTADAAETYFKEKAGRVTPRALCTSMGLANIAAGLFGAMPMCHGSAGLTAHYRLGARTGGANLMIGCMMLAIGLLFGYTTPAVLSTVPLAVLGVLLAIVGVYHALLVRDLAGTSERLVAAAVAIVTVIGDNLALGFLAGILLYHLLKIAGAKAVK